MNSTAMRWRFYLIMLLCSGISFHTYASDTVLIQSIRQLDSLPISDHAAFFEDPSGKMSWQDVSKQTFTQMNGRPLLWFDTAYGKRRATVWFRFTLHNATNDAAHIALLFYFNAFFRETVVISSGDTLIQIPNYFFSPTQKINRSNVIAALTPGKRLTYFICIKNPFANLGSMTIRTVPAYNEWKDHFYRTWSTNYMAKIMFLGVILFITLHTLAQYFMRRRREFARYALYAAGVFFLFLHNIESAPFFNVFFSFFPYVQKFASQPLFMLVSWLYLRFAREYVDFKSLAPWYHQVIIWTERLIGATVLTGMMIDIVFNDYPLAKQVYVALRILLFPVSFAAVYLLLRSGKKALYFIGAGILSMTTGVLLAMICFYWPHLNPFPQIENIWYMEIGIVLELLCFTAGLSYKTRLIEEEKQQTQQQLIRQLEANHGLKNALNLQLEAKTKEQTEQILAQQRELEKEKEQQLTLEFTRKISEMELQLLKTQLNPHFYFNTLNNLYGLAMIAPKKAPGAILKLSDIMEYVIYDCRQDKVCLAKELKFLQSYIELEKLRYDENVHISMHVQGKPDNRSISPMLLIQFVENGFKHGIEKEKSQSFLHVNIKVQNGSLEYESVNSNRCETGKNGGVGLTNVRKRLDLLYPEKHQLQVLHDDNEFRVKLKLTL